MLNHSSSNVENVSENLGPYLLVYDCNTACKYQDNLKLNVTNSSSTVKKTIRKGGKSVEWTAAPEKSKLTSLL